jgi:hypothetical protein
MHVSKIRCDRKSEKFCKIFWELNRALEVVSRSLASAPWKWFIMKGQALLVCIDGWQVKRTRGCLSKQKKDPRDILIHDAITEFFSLGAKCQWTFCKGLMLHCATNLVPISE